MEIKYPVSIVVADDDLEDRLSIRRAFRVHGLATPYFTENGQDLLDYLLGHNSLGMTPVPKPGLILLDLNMPGMDGRSALQAIKSHAELKEIPVIVFTASEEEDDISSSYGLGANSYIIKPNNYKGLLKIIGSIKNYWMNTVRTIHSGISV